MQKFNLSTPSRELSFGLLFLLFRFAGTKTVAPFSFPYFVCLDLVPQRSLTSQFLATCHSHSKLILHSYILESSVQWDFFRFVILAVSLRRVPKLILFFPSITLLFRFNAMKSFTTPLDLLLFLLPRSVGFSQTVMLILKSLLSLILYFFLFLSVCQEDHFVVCYSWCVSLTRPTLNIPIFQYHLIPLFNITSSLYLDLYNLTCSALREFHYSLSFVLHFSSIALFSFIQFNITVRLHFTAGTVPRDLLFSHSWLALYLINKPKLWF